MCEYFSDDMNPENDHLIPAGVSIEDAPDFHRELCDLLDEVSGVNPIARVCYATPQRYAKSTYLSNAFPVHQICYGNRKYILIISETDAASKKFIEWVTLQLKVNNKFRDVFGNLLDPKKALNKRC